MGWAMADECRVICQVKAYRPNTLDVSGNDVGRVEENGSHLMIVTYLSSGLNPRILAR